MRVEIRKNCYGKSGYQICKVCGKWEGYKPLPLMVWHIGEGEKRGHNVPVCSRECAEKVVERLEGE